MTSIVRLDNEQIKESYDGFDLYFDRQDKILYSSPKCLARWVNCDPKTIKRVAGTLKAGKESQILTAQGMQRGTLYTSPEVVAILDALADGKRTKKETKAKARERLTLLATLGNELGGMLAIAPEELAKIAISHTTTKEQSSDIQEHLTRHKQYLKEYHGLHDLLKQRKADRIHYACVNRHNDDLIGLPPGDRSKMSDRQKDEITLLQLVEKMKLEDTETKTP